MAGAASHAAYRDENDVSLWIVFWVREVRRPHDRLAMGGGQWQTLFTD